MSTALTETFLPLEVHVGREIKAHMARRDLNERMLAAMLGWTQQKLSSRLHQGKTSVIMNLAELEEVAGVLGVPVTELVSRKPYYSASRSDNWCSSFPQVIYRQSAWNVTERDLTAVGGSNTRYRYCQVSRPPARPAVTAGNFPVRVAGTRAGRACWRYCAGATPAHGGRGLACPLS